MFRTLVTLGGAALAGSAFIPWLAGPFGQTAIPYDILRLFHEQNGWQMPREALVFMSTFGVGAAIALLALIGAAPRLLAFLAGVYPPGLLAYAVIRERAKLGEFGVPVPQDTDLGTLWDIVSPLIGNGLWIFLGASAVIVLGSLMPRR